MEDSYMGEIKYYKERRCPHCGRTNGLYAKYAYRDVKMFYNFDGNVEENMDESYKDGGKRLYCRVCDKYVCKEEDYNKKHWGYFKSVAKKLIEETRWIPAHVKNVPVKSANNIFIYLK